MTDSDFWGSTQVPVLEDAVQFKKEQERARQYNSSNMDFKKYAELMKVMNNYSSTFTQVQQIVDII